MTDTSHCEKREDEGVEPEVLKDLDVSEDDSDAVVAGVCAKNRAAYSATTRNN